MKKSFLHLLLLLSPFLIISCDHGPAGTSGQAHQSSLGEAIESSLSQPHAQKEIQSHAHQQQQYLQARQQKLQQERLKSYSNTSGYDRNP